MCLGLYHFSECLLGIYLIKTWLSKLYLNCVKNYKKYICIVYFLKKNFSVLVNNASLEDITPLNNECTALSLMTGSYPELYQQSTESLCVQLSKGAPYLNFLIFQERDFGPLNFSGLSVSAFSRQ